MKKPRSPLEHVKHLIKKLSAEDKQKIVPYLAQLSDSGVQSYDLREEIKVLEKHGTVLPPGGSEDQVSLVFIRDLVEARVGNRKVVHARFFHDEFVEGFPHYVAGLELTASKYKERLYTPEKRVEIRARRVAEGIQETDVEFE